MDRTSQSSTSSRVITVDTLRGTAALAVCIYHLSAHLPGSSIFNRVVNATSLSHIGVFMFFAISGFIIPYALDRAHYSPRVGFWRYLARRVVRLDPPYFASMVLTMAIVFAANLTPGYRGAPFDFTWPQVLLHFGYLNGIAGYPWVNGVFWTLAIEFQFYILLAMVFPLLVSRSPYVRWGCLATFWLASLLSPIRTYPNSPYDVFVFDYLAIFSMGILAFQYRTGRIRWAELLIGVAIAWMVDAFSFNSSVALIASLMIASVNMPELRLTTFFAAISYSLYLTHVPVGRSAVHLGMRVIPDHPLAEVALLLASTALCIFVAYVSYRLFERPAQLLAARIDYARRPKTQVAAAAAPAATSVALPETELSSN